jgi:hypothetical protein
MNASHSMESTAASNHSSADTCPAIDNLVAAMPAGPALDEILALVRIGLTFKSQQCGRRPGFLAKEIRCAALRIGEPVTFERILVELENAAVRRDRDGEAASPFESVNRVWELVTYHHPRRGRIQVTFKTIRNKVTICKKNVTA